MLKVFNNTTAEGLKHFSTQIGRDTSATQKFILMMSKLWKILDNRDQFKCVRFNDKDRQPIFSINDASVYFIVYFKSINKMKLLSPLSASKAKIISRCQCCVHDKCNSVAGYMEQIY